MKKKPCELTCPKCGSSDNSLKFFAKGFFLHSYDNDRKQKETKYMKSDQHGYIAKQDCLLHHCRCCEYEWETEPLRKK